MKQMLLSVCLDKSIKETMRLVPLLPLSIAFPLRFYPSSALLQLQDTKLYTTNSQAGLDYKHYSNTTDSSRHFQNFPAFGQTCLIASLSSSPPLPLPQQSSTQSCLATNALCSAMALHARNAAASQQLHPSRPHYCQPATSPSPSILRRH